MMRKEPIPGNSGARSELSSRRLLTTLLATVRRALPANWSAELDERPVVSSHAPSAARPDATVTIRAPDGATAAVVIEAKSRLEPSQVRLIADQIHLLQAQQDAQAGVVVAPFLSPRARELLRGAGLSYADSTGNFRLVLDRPAVLIETVGASSDPWSRTSERPLRSLKGPTASRVVRALCDFRPPFGVQQLAERSGTSLASVARVFALLGSEALIERERLGPVTEVKWADLIRRWTADYGFLKKNRIQTFLEPRGLPALLEKLRGAPWCYAVTGSLAAVDLAPIAAPRLATIYVDDASEAAAHLRLRATEASANVILAEPFDPVVYDRTRELANVEYAAPSQVAADLLTSPGRGPAEGEELIRWMQEHENAWRR